MAIPKKFSLKREKENLFKVKSERVNSTNFSLIFSNLDPQDDFMVGIVISKKVFSRAVDRNRTKRIISNEINQLRKTNKISNKKILVIAKPSLANQPKQAIVKEIESLFIKNLLMPKTNFSKAT